MSPVSSTTGHSRVPPKRHSRHPPYTCRREVQETGETARNEERGATCVVWEWVGLGPSGVVNFLDPLTPCKGALGFGSWCG